MSDVVANDFLPPFFTKLLSNTKTQYRTYRLVCVATKKGSVKLGMDKFKWIDGFGKQCLFTKDCQFAKPKIHTNDRILCKKLKRNYYKKIAKHDIKMASNEVSR